MSENNMKRRLAKLEQAAAPKQTVYAWNEDGETVEQSIALAFPDGVPTGARVVVYSWAPASDEAAAAMPDAGDGAALH
jgi:hypothetical protein